jgi:exodeoxyribonuclease VII large subunit
VEDQENVFTVTQLTGLIKEMLEGSFKSVSLKGEISNFRPNASGHLYFVLKDNESQISAVMFRGRAGALTFTPKDGMLVQVRGQISVYAPRGNYQIIITTMAQSGVGGIMEMIEERKKRLAAEGLFDSGRKRSLPFFPSTVGVVTSPTGAALRDILQITRRRNDKVSVTVLPALVQGDGAAQSIIHMIELANKYSMCDVLIVGRGGGSLEDLLPFSDEGVVRAIASSKIPVVSAVGHEIDWALSDFAADVRAPTPSAAAELVVPLKQEILDRIITQRDDLYRTIENRMQTLRLMVKSFTPQNMELQFRTIEQPLMVRYDNAKRALVQNMEDLLTQKRQLVKDCATVLEACNPQTIFDRGYSMVTDSATGTVIRSGSQVTKGAALTIRPAKGTISATVTQIDGNE